MNESPHLHRPRVMRMLGVGALGLVGGVLLALFVQDFLAVALVRLGSVPSMPAVVFDYLFPIISIVTAVAAVIIDRRVALRRTDKNSHDD
ncbi:hypothetical protein [Leucobacter sp. GX24907]